MRVISSFIFDHDITSSTAHDVQIQLSSKVAEMILQKAVGHQSLSMFVSQSQHDIVELNENGLTKIKSCFDLT